MGHYEVDVASFDIPLRYVRALRGQFVATLCSVKPREVLSCEASAKTRRQVAPQHRHRQLTSAVERNCDESIMSMRA
jgi:hypothetical protein